MLVLPISVALQQPAQAFLQVSVIDAWVKILKLLPAESVGGVEKETHAFLQHGHTVRPRHTLNNHVLTNATQTVKHETVDLCPRLKIRRSCNVID